MEDISNISSEEELLQLRNEGKISEDEYEELRSAMRKSAKPDFEPPPVATDSSKSKRRLGKIAFCLMLLGIVVVPVWLWVNAAYRKTDPIRVSVPTEHVVGPNGEKSTASAGEVFAEVVGGEGEVRRGCSPLHIGLILILEIAAVAMSVIAWPDVFAKATVVTISFVVVLVFLFLIAVIVFPI